MMQAQRNKERGVALIMVLIAIAITLVISNDFGTASNTDMTAAANYRDEMRAHFLARSAQNLAELVLVVQAELDEMHRKNKSIPQMQITDFADQIVLPFCGDAEQVRDAVGVSTSDVQGLGADVGTCGFNGGFETEDNKINLNCVKSGGETAGVIKTALLALVYFPAYDPLFEEPDAEGWRRDRETQVNALIDYIDSDSIRGPVGSNQGAAGGEDYGYESLKDRYVAKNWYADSLGELKLARGVDDRFWSLFGNQLTVYGSCKINLGAVTDPQLIAAVLLIAADETNGTQPTVQDPRKLFMLAGVVAKAKQFGESFDDSRQFIDFVKDPIAALGMLASDASAGMAGSAAGTALAQGLGIPPGEKIGLVLNQKQLERVATFGARRSYRIEAWGEIERKAKNADGTPLFPPIRKTVTGIWNVGPPKQGRKNAPDAPKGVWEFLRED
jgi:general secretion pathway protein K